MGMDDRFLGIVQSGELQILAPESASGSSAKLTAMGMQAAMPPEGHQVDLGEHEGKAILVQGHGDGDWIYSASIVEVAGPILTAVVSKAFG